MEMVNRFLSELGVIDKGVIEEYESFYSEIKYWNNRLNLVSDLQEFEIKHIIDSISIAKYFIFNEEIIIDIGTGAGLPGIPLKILFPKIKLFLVDSSTKKIDVLKKIIRKIGLINVECINDNVEKLARKTEYRERFDFALCRAVAKLSTIIEYSIPFLRVGGKLIAYKGPTESVDNLDNCLKKLNSKIEQNIDFILPFSDYKRKFVVVEKLWKTDEIYPRRVGLPKKKPL